MQKGLPLLSRHTYSDTLRDSFCNSFCEDNPVGPVPFLTEGIGTVSQPPRRAFYFCSHTNATPYATRRNHTLPRAHPNAPPGIASPRPGITRPGYPHRVDPAPPPVGVQDGAAYLFTFKMREI